MTPDAAPARTGPILRVADLAKGEIREIEVMPDADTLRGIARALDLVDLRKLRFTGQLSPLGKRDWRLTGHLGATAVQTCVVTLAPVTTRVEEDVARNWVSDFEVPQGDEVEVPETVDDEPLGAEIDVGSVIIEALALALPAYPRADGAALGDAAFTAPGETPMTDEDVKPFAGLAALRDKLTGGDDESSG